MLLGARQDQIHLAYLVQLSVTSLSPAILRVCNVLYYQTSVSFVANKANCFTCSSQQSWRAAGWCFLDNDLYKLSWEHTFPISCCCFSSLDKLNSCSYTVFSKVFPPRPKLFSSVFFQVYSHHLSHSRTKVMVEFESQQHRQDGVTLEHSCYCIPAWGWLYLRQLESHRFIWSEAPSCSQVLHSQVHPCTPF